VKNHPRQRAARNRALAAYYNTHLLHADRFLCRHCAACKASYLGKEGQFIEAQLNAPGSHYDLTVDGQPLRIVVVGQESGTGIAHRTMAQRQRSINKSATAERFVAEAGYPARTQHMKGITNLLRLLFGKGLGTDYAGEFIDLDHGGQIHLLHCFALVNYLLCSAHSSQRSKRGESTATMRRNCNEHFRATLEILAPTVIIVEGKAMWPALRRAFDTLTPMADHLYQATIGGHEAWVLSFTHPSAMHPHNWGINAETPYLLKTVVPTVARLRQLLWHNERS